MHDAGVQLPGDLSPDRLWRWDGMRWVPTESGRPPLVVSHATSGRSLAAIAGGVIAIVSGLLIIVACALPFVHYTDSQEPTSPSIFNPGFAPSNGFAVEPVGVALIAIAVGILVLVWSNRIARAIASGVLIAYGVQTVLLFFGYLALAVFSKSAQVGPGGPVGMFAGLLLIAGGAACLASVLSKGSAQTA
jgi:tryptophan-rich sensory protein